MNKIIPFNKVIRLDEEVDEISKISLSDTLALFDEYTIKGDLMVCGAYKIENEEKNFSYPIPVEITIDDKYDTSTCKIKIDDFYYELINGQDLRVKIDLLLDNLFYKEKIINKEEIILEDNRQDPIIEEVKEPPKPKVIDTNLESDATIKRANDDLDNLFKDTTDDVDYSIYRVYTVGDGETIEFIMDKYGVTKEDITDYNDIENFQPGMKLIIPSKDEWNWKNIKET